MNQTKTNLLYNGIDIVINYFTHVAFPIISGEESTQIMDHDTFMKEYNNPKVTGFNIIKKVPHTKDGVETIVLEPSNEIEQTFYKENISF